MNILSVIAAALFAASSAVTIASAQPAASANPDNAAAATPALIYQSSTTGFVALQEPAVSPASNWRAVNQAVGSYDSMAATIDDAPAITPVAATDAPPPAATDQQTTSKPKPMAHGSHMTMPMDMPADVKKGHK